MRSLSNPEMSSSSSFVPVAGKSFGGTGFPRFRKLIESATYKPGYELTLVIPEKAEVNGAHLSFDNMPAFLYLKAYIQDSRAVCPKLFPLQFQAAILPHIEDMPDEVQRSYLREILRTFEEHELDEWLRVDGELVNDPHASKE
ncbi:hypothetical protein SEA_JACOREN57_59 [Mycobacterium phage JacoRen57]|nr:hypothetical protein SEA_JACOREN57_59 [Mycobacterium phage JacoRen57]